MSCSKRDLCVYLSVASILIIGFGSSSAVIYIKGEKYTDGGTCPTFPKNITYAQANKIISSQWNWKYRHTNNGTTLTIEQKCPTMTHDANIYLDGILAARTEGEIISLTSKVQYQFCHGNLLYIFEASDFGQVILKPK